MRNPARDLVFALRLRNIAGTVADSYPSGNRREARRWWCGWAAVTSSTAIAAFWAFWGAAETFRAATTWPATRGAGHPPSR